MNRPATTIAYLGVLAIFAAAGCNQRDGSSNIEKWFDATRRLVEQTKPGSDEMQIDASADCELVDDLDVDGRHPELFGAATARFGEVGNRYQCAWSGDSNASANVRLEVVIIDDPAAFASYASLVPTRDGDTVVSTEVGDIHVASFEPDLERPIVTTSILMVPEQQGAVQLVVELLDPVLDWTADDHAALLARLAR